MWNINLEIFSREKLIKNVIHFSDNPTFFDFSYAIMVYVHKHCVEVRRSTQRGREKQIVPVRCNISLSITRIARGRSFYSVEQSNCRLSRDNFPRKAVRKERVSGRPLIDRVRIAKIEVPETH